MTNQYPIEIQKKKKKELTFPLGLLAMASNLIRAVPPWASTRLISSTKSGASLMIIAKASGLLPATKLKVSSTAGPAVAAVEAVVPDARLRGLEAEAEPPSERRPAAGGAEGR